MTKFAAALLATAIIVVDSPAVPAASGVWNFGSSADIAAVREAILANPDVKVPGVHVVGDYALTQVYIGTEASGMWVYKRISAEHWKRIMGGGGAVDATMMSGAGVPPSIARRLCSGWPKGYGC